MTTKLEQAARQIIVDWDSGIHLYEAITTLREALEQPEQEPSIDFDKLHEMNMQYVECPACGSDMAMAYSPKKQAEQEPVGVFANVNALTPEKGARWEQMIDSAYDGVEYIHLYAAPVRTKDLTDEELNAMWYGNTKDGWLGLFRAVIAADRELNK